MRVGLDMGMLVQQSRLKAGLSQKDLAGVSFSNPSLLDGNNSCTGKKSKGTSMMAFGHTDVRAYHLLASLSWLAE